MHLEFYAHRWQQEKEELEASEEVKVQAQPHEILSQKSQMEGWDGYHQNSLYTCMKF